MIEIWQECASFQTLSWRLAEQVRKILMKGWLSDLEILEIHQIQTMNKTVKQYQAHQVLTNKHSLSKMKRKYLKLKTPQPWTTEQTPTQEEK